VLPEDKDFLNRLSIEKQGLFLVFPF